MGLLGTADAMKLAFQCVRTPSISGFMSFRPGFGVWFGVRPAGGGPGAPSGSGLEGELSGSGLEGELSGGGPRVSCRGAGLG